jgi:hypothetical protein
MMKMNRNKKSGLKAWVLFLLIAVLLNSSFLSACGKKPDTEAEYAELVDELTTCLVDFTTFDLISAIEENQSADELAVRRDQFNEAFFQLRELTPPTEYREFHTEALPVYDYIRQGMDMIIEAVAENDRAKLLAGRTLVAEAANTISTMLKED